MEARWTADASYDSTTSLVLTQVDSSTSSRVPSIDSKGTQKPKTLQHLDRAFSGMLGC